MSKLNPQQQHELVEKLITRPLAERVREQKYRCAQSIVFGLPVIALQYFGAKLGGAEAPKFVAVMQAILSGWVTFVAATGMISEGTILFLTRRKITLDFLIAMIATILEVLSIVAAVSLLVGRTLFAPQFHWVILLLIVWTAWRWFTLNIQLRLVEKFNRRSQT